MFLQKDSTKDENDFVDIKEIGSGQGGIVFKCLHIPSGNIYARKMISVRADSPRQLKSITAELSALSKVSSPHVVQVVRVLYKELRVSVVMEWMDRGSLASLLHSYGPLPEHLLSFICRNVLSALIELLKAGIVHRDLKPGNLLVNSRGQVKLCDFGECTSWWNQSHRRLKSQVGTVAYMAPERIFGYEYDERSEVWSLGITALELFLGHHPLLQRIQQTDNSSSNGGLLTPPISAANKLSRSSAPLAEVVADIEIAQIVSNDNILEPYSSQLSPSFYSFLKCCLHKKPEKRPRLPDLLLHPFIMRHLNVESQDLRHDYLHISLQMLLLLLNWLLIVGSCHVSPILNSYIYLLKPCLNQNEILTIHSFLSFLPVMHTHLPEVYYSPQGAKALQLYKPIKNQAKALALLIHKNCASKISASAITILSLDLIVNATLIEGYFRTKNNFQFRLREQFVCPALSALYPELRANALEELRAMMDYFSYATSTIARMENVMIYQLSAMQLQLLECFDTPKLYQHKVFLHSPVTVPDLSPWKSLLQQKERIWERPLEIISKSRQMLLLKKHHGVSMGDYCLQRFYYTKVLQLSESLSHMPLSHFYVQMQVYLEIQKHVLPQLASIVGITYDSLFSIKEFDESFLPLISLPTFFKLFLSSTRYERLSSMLLRDYLLAIQGHIFPKYEDNQKNITLQIAKEASSGSEFEIIKMWSEIQIPPTGYHVLFHDLQASDPQISLYAFATYLVFLMEFSLQDEITKDTQKWIENTVNIGTQIIKALLLYIKNEALVVRIQMLLDSLVVLSNQKTQMGNFYYSLKSKLNMLLQLRQ